MLDSPGPRVRKIMGDEKSFSCPLREGATLPKPESPDVNLDALPPSCLGPDGKLRRMSEEEHRLYIESALRRLDEIDQMTDEDPPGAFEEFMRGLDEGRPHRPQFKGYY